MKSRKSDYFLLIKDYEDFAAIECKICDIENVLKIIDIDIIEINA